MSSDEPLTGRDEPAADSGLSGSMPPAAEATQTDASQTTPPEGATPETEESPASPAAAPTEPATETAAAESATPAAPAGESPDSASAASAPAVETAPAAETPAAASSAETPRRRPQLNPTANPDQHRAVPSVPGSGQAAVATPAPTATEASPANSGPGSVSISPEDVPAGEAEPSTAGSAPVKPATVEIPSGDALDPSIEAQIEQAMAAGTASAPVAAAEQPADDSDSSSDSGGQAAVEVSEDSLEPGARLQAKIQSISGDDVFVDVGLRSPGVLSRRQFEAAHKPEVGQRLEVVVDRIDEEEGLIHLNLPRGVRRLAGNWESVEKGQILDCMVTGSNKGGLEVNISNLRGFLPASQVELGYVDDLAPYVGQKLRVRVTEVNAKKRNLVVSRRAWLEEERKELEAELWKTLAVGQKFGGRVKTIKDYGAFIDIGGADGFLHVGEISWTRVRHPDEVLSVGQEVEVQVISLDEEKKRIGLGMRQLVANPWTTAESTYAQGSTVEGRVTRTADFGAFVELEPGVEGLVHISELDHQRVRRVTDVVKDGDTVQVQVLEVDPKKRRISLSLKALKDAPEQPKDEDIAPGGGQPYQRKRTGPLKGGTGGSGGGGLFGNPTDFG